MNVKGVAMWINTGVKGTEAESGKTILPTALMV